MLALDAVRVALKRNRSVFDVGQYVAADSAVEIDDLPLREAGFRVKYFIKVRESEFFVADFERQ